MKKTIFIVGAGKGLGNAVARKFAAEDFRIVLMSRSAGHLEAYCREMKEEGIDAAVQVADAADTSSLEAAMNQAIRTFGVPDVLFYNVGITTADGELPGPVTADIMAQRYAIDVLGAYTCINQTLGEEFSRKNGTVLITGGGLALSPHASYLPLSMDKAALRAMVQALHPVLQEQNVFIGSIQVCGLIGGSEKYMPEKIAGLFWKLYQDRTDSEIIY